MTLPALDPQRVPDTPWDPALADEVRRVGLAVEEERVMDALLAEHAAGDRGGSAPVVSEPSRGAAR